MTDQELARRLREFYRAEAGDEDMAPLSLRAAVVAIPRRTATGGRGLGRLSRRTWLLVAAGIAIGAGVLGSSLVGGQRVTPRPAPTAPAAVVASPSAAASPSTSNTAASTSPVPSVPAVPDRSPSVTTAGSLASRAFGSTATLLSDGRVLLSGGRVPSPTDPMAAIAVASAQLYDPSTRTWVAAAAMGVARTGHTATLLSDGRVLVAGGTSEAGPLLSSAELYDPSTGSWTPAGTMSSPHSGGTATVLSDGRVLVAGGQAAEGRDATAAADIFDPASGSWSATGSMAEPRVEHTATLLRDGRVLVAGGGKTTPESPALATAELYDPSTGTWTATGSMATPHRAHTATLLPDGRVLVAGGYPTSVSFTFPFPPMASAELYDPATGSWTATGDMGTPRTGQIATLLPDGRVLVVGGSYEVRSEQDVTGGSAATAEAWDPRTGSWAPAGTMPADGSVLAALRDGRFLLAGVGTAAHVFDPGSGLPSGSAPLTPNPSRAPWVATSPSPAPSGPPGSGWAMTGNVVVARSQQTATVLSDGRVLVVGGADTAAGELYDPVTRTWTATGSMSTPRTGHTATLLPDGRVLVAGGYVANGSFASAELYDPTTGTWTTTGSMTLGRRYATATLLPDGLVLVAGGMGNGPNMEMVASAELYDPRTGRWTRTGSMTSARVYHKATLLPNGKVLVTGGGNGNEGGPATGDLYDPGRGTWTATRRMASPGQGDSATLLPDGRVLVAGGANGAIAQLYDPRTGAWTRTGSMTMPRRNQTATLLPNGTVLVTGGEYQPTRAQMIAALLGGSAARLTTAELYDPATGRWTATASLLTSRDFNDTATLLRDGTVLLVGGNDLDMGIVGSAELYDPGSP